MQRKVFYDSGIKRFYVGRSVRFFLKKRLNDLKFSLGELGKMPICFKIFPIRLYKNI